MTDGYGIDNAPPFAGKELGRGDHRIVYAHTDDPSLVVKVPRGENTANTQEWYFWILLNMAGLAHHVAPCVEIAADGSWLTMKRTEPLTEPVAIEVPIVLAMDTVLQNWGMLDGRIVCHDYQTFTVPLLIKNLMAAPRRIQIV